MNESIFRPAELEPAFTLGPWRVVPGSNAIIRGSEKKHLENRLMQTLVCLARHRGQPVSRQQFFDTVWQGRVVNEEALSRAISLLRSKLEDDAQAPKFIQTIPGVGYRLIADVGVTQTGRGTPPPSVRIQPNSIAVLPFVNLSEDPGNEYFSDGITEEILNVLTQVKRFKVAGRTSSFVFKNRNEDLREIGTALGVSHVLEGSVRKANSKVRITAQLIKAADGFHLWSKTFDRSLGDIFEVQDEIAMAVVKALKSRLLGKPGKYRVVGGTENAEAFQAYLVGLYHRNRGVRKENVYAAETAFQKAIQLDPGYALAHSSLAYTVFDLICNGYVEVEDGRNRVFDAANKAIELAPDLADGHLVLGLMRVLGIPQWDAAQRAINRALELNPGNAKVLVEYSRLNCCLGHHKRSVDAARKAQEVEPISVFANHFLGHVLYFARRYDEAIPAFRHALELDSNYPKPHYFISLCLYFLGETEAAWREIQLEPLDWMRWTASAAILHRLGRTREAEANFASLAAIGVEENNFMQQADIHAQMGDTDQAIEDLKTALHYRDPGFTQLKIDPLLDPIRDDPRFKEIMSRVGF